MTRQPHCDHECVCPAVSGVMRSRKDVCEVYACPNDTRTTRPATSPCVQCLEEDRVSMMEHDAALIAQEREKWERERLSCVEDITPEGGAIVQAVKKQAREDVLDELAQMYANVPEQFLEGTYRLHSEWKEKIESLRSSSEVQHHSEVRR